MDVWQGRCAVVTGGASGIGRAVAVMMKQQGANVVVGDVNLPAKEVPPDGFPVRDGIPHLLP